MNKCVLFTLILLASAWTAGCKPGSGLSPGGHPQLKTEEDKTLYSMGLMVARSLRGFNLAPAEVELVKAGLTDALSGRKPEVEIEVYGPKVQTWAQRRGAAQTDAEKAKSKTFAETAAKAPGAVKTPSGLVFLSLKPGTGPTPEASDRVKVHYQGTLIDGTVFDSSIKRGQPAEFPLRGVVPCWTEALQKMKVGEKAKLVCPSEIAYGDHGRPPSIPGGATLIFEVELLEIMKQPAAPTPGALPPGVPIPGAPIPGAKPGAAARPPISLPPPSPPPTH